MLRRSHRFHGYNSLQYVYRHGSTVRSGDLSLRYSLNNKRQDYRAAVVVSKKVHKSAVVRNRIRRRIFEQIRLLESQIKQPYDIVVSVHSDRVATIPVSELHEQVNKQLIAAKIIN